MYNYPNNICNMKIKNKRRNTIVILISFIINIYSHILSYVKITKI